MQMIVPATYTKLLNLLLIPAIMQTLQQSSNTSIPEKKAGEGKPCENAAILKGGGLKSALGILAIQL